MDGPSCCKRNCSVIHLFATLAQSALSRLILVPFSRFLGYSTPLLNASWPGLVSALNLAPIKRTPPSASFVGKPLPLWGIKTDGAGEQLRPCLGRPMILRREPIYLDFLSLSLSLQLHSNKQLLLNLQSGLHLTPSLSTTQEANDAHFICEVPLLLSRLNQDQPWYGRGLCSVLDPAYWFNLDITAALNIDSLITRGTPTGLTPEKSLTSVFSAESQKPDLYLIFTGQLCIAFLEWYSVSFTRQGWLAL